MMELRHLEHFVAVAEEGSFTRAARRLSYVQSALSVSVQALERELGVRLFDRTTHRVVLTSAGEALLPAARRVLSAAEETRDLAASLRGVLRGRLRIGLMQSLTFDMPSVLGEFHRLHPEVELQLRPASGGSAALLEELRQGTIDLAFVALLDKPAGVTMTPLGSEDLILVAAPELAPAGRGRLGLHALVEASFVDFPVGWGIRTATDRAFAEAGLERHVTIEAADVSTLLQLVEAGLGVALVPPSLLRGGDRRLVQRPLLPAITWHVVLAMASGQAPSAAARAFAEMVIDRTRT
jgi:DNA-binding transcriptional LysR family regulator